MSEQEDYEKERSELIRSMEQMAVDTAAKRREIQRVQNKARKTRKHVEQKWFDAAENFLREKNVERQRLQLRLGEVRHAIRNCRAETEAQLFIIAARTVLPEIMYRAVWDEVTRLVQQKREP